jgi:hypothetical protein
MTSESPLPSPAEFAALETDLFDRIAVRYRRQVLRRRLAATAVVLAVAGGGIAAGTVANTRQQRDLATCYSADSLSSRSAQDLISNGVDPAPGHRPSTARVESAVAMCVTLWKSGVFGTPSSTQPILQACLQDNLVIAVFPRKAGSPGAEAFCNNLGLTAP